MRPRTKPHPLETPNTILIRKHYEKLGLHKPWSADRVHRLCALFPITIWELAAISCIDFTIMRRWLESNTFPTYACLHFAMLESFWFERTHGIQSDPIIPINLLSSHQR